MDPDRVILRLSTQDVNVFLSLKTGEELVKNEKPSSFTRNGKTDPGGVIQLPEAAGEGRFATLVGTDNDNDLLLVFQVEIGAHNNYLLLDKVAGSCEFKTLVF